MILCTDVLYSAIAPSQAKISWKKLGVWVERQLELCQKIKILPSLSPRATTTCIE